MDGQEKTLLVHRKGSTRAFPPHHPLIPVDYQLTGQPVLIGGTMGTHSYVLTGAQSPAWQACNVQLCARRPWGYLTSMSIDTHSSRPAAHWCCQFQCSRATGLLASGNRSCCLRLVMLVAGSAGTQKGMAETFGSTCHGAGRASSRNSARRTLDYQTVGHCLLNALSCITEMPLDLY